MDSRWFKEDRELPKDERQKAQSDTKEVLLHSTLMTERLKRIIREDIQLTYTDDENVGGPAWERRVLVNVGKRKALAKILDILP